MVAELREDAARSTGLVREYTGLVAADATAPAPRRRPAGLDPRQHRELRPVAHPLRRQGHREEGSAERRSPRPSGRGSRAPRSVPCWASSAARCSGSSTRSTRRRAGCCSSRPTSSTSSASSTPTPPTSGSGSACTRRPTACSSPRCRGCATTSTSRSAGCPTSSSRPDCSTTASRASPRRSRAGRRGSLLDILGSPEQREIMDHLTGVMSLLEGHADVVMDGVGPSVIPSVKDIRKKFTRRRQGVGMLDKFLRRALGLDAKMAQYRDGAAFVRGVVDKVGMADFNVVWQDPAHLPTKAEIADPAAWVTRVLVTGRRDRARPRRRRHPGGRTAGARRRRPRLRPRPGRLLGRRRLAGPAGRRRLRGARAALARRRRHRRPRPARGVRRGRDPRGRADGRARRRRDRLDPGQGRG